MNLVHYHMLDLGLLHGVYHSQGNQMPRLFVYDSLSSRRVKYSGRIFRYKKIHIIQHLGVEDPSLELCESKWCEFLST